MFRRSSRLLVADLGSTRLSCASFRAGRDGRMVLDHVFVEALDSDVSIESLWRERVSRALAKIPADRRSGKPLSVALPGHLTLTKFIKIAAVERSKRRKVIEFEASQAMPYSLDDIVWDYLELAEDRTDLEIMLSAAKTESMLGLCAAVSSSDFTVGHATPSCLALFDGFRYSYPEVDGSTLVVDVGARSTQVLLVENGRFVARNLSFGANAVTQAMAEELGLDFRSAENLKTELVRGSGERTGTANDLALQRGVTALVTRLRAEVMRTTIGFRQHTPAGHPASVYVTGQGAPWPEVEQGLGDLLKVPVHRIDVLRRIELAPAARKDRSEPGSMPLQLIGLASRHLTLRPSPLNLLPPVVKDELAFRRRQPALIAAAILVVGALVPPLQYFHSLATAREAKAADLEVQTRPLQDIHKRNAELQQKIDEATAGVLAWRDVADRQTTWLRFFADLQGRLVAVEDVWLESLSVVRPAAHKPGSTAASQSPGDVRIVLSGRLLDQAHPVSKVSPDSYERVKRLIASMRGSEFVADVEQEHFDNSVAGILRFDFTLVVRTDRPL